MPILTDTETAPVRVQTRLFVIIFAVLIAALAGGYFMFMRADYVVLYSELRPAEASVIVTELDRRGVDYRLGQGGSSILVTAGDADRLRVGLAGARLPTSGEVGFELFNESSMGLTDFAQKINYQRALQGELARTIMAMDGIETARVHLAIPERALFRGNRAEPRAAVTVIPRRGLTLEEARVVGIQRLVASAVPDLALGNVTVLDALGRVISPTAVPVDATPPELSAERARYAAVLRTAVAQAAPGLVFQVELTLAPAAGALAAPVDMSAETGVRTFNVDASILTAVPVPAELQARIMATVRATAALDESAGDRLSFRLTVPTTTVPVTNMPPVQPPAIIQPGPGAETRSGLWTYLTANWVALTALFAIGALLLVGWRRSFTVWTRERSALVDRIRMHLQNEPDAHV